MLDICFEIQNRKQAGDLRDKPHFPIIPRPRHWNYCIDAPIDFVNFTFRNKDLNLYISYTGSLISTVFHIRVLCMMHRSHTLLLFCSWIASSLQRQSEVTFDSLLTPEADRFTAAYTFHKLLGEDIRTCWSLLMIWIWFQFRDLCIECRLYRHVMVSICHIFLPPELLSAGHVTAHQSKPYHNITINAVRMAAWTHLQCHTVYTRPVNIFNPFI